MSQSEIAVHTKDSEPQGVMILLEPLIKGQFGRLARLTTTPVDVIQREKLIMNFTTANTLRATISRKGSFLQPLMHALMYCEGMLPVLPVVVFLTLSKLLLVGRIILSRFHAVGFSDVGMSLAIDALLRSYALLVFCIVEPFAFASVVLHRHIIPVRTQPCNRVS